jgi:hypothetical protein
MGEAVTDQLTQFVLRIGGPGFRGNGPSENSGAYLKYLWGKEIILGMGSVLVAVAGGMMMVLLGYIGELAAGDRGLHAMENVSFAVVGFGLAGFVIHWLRAITNMIYRRIVFRGQETDLLESVAPPPRVMLPFLTSTDWDFVLQAAAAVVTGVIAFRLNP